MICGPTAGGKTALALAVAEQLSSRGLGSEIVSADAYLVYQDLDIGTAKPTAEELAKVPHHLVDIVLPTEGFTLAQWLGLAERAIAEIKGRGRVPIVVGGTHLFIKALIDGLFEGPEPDPELRARLQALPTDELRRRLEAVDPDAAARIHPADTRRSIRALEVYEQTGQTITSLQIQWDRQHPRDTSAQLVVLSWKTATINSRINARVKQMRQAGLTEEVRSLHEADRLGPTAGQALGYKQLVDHFQGRCSEDDAYERIKIETRRFAKNQRTWLRRLQTTPGTLTLCPEEQDPATMAQSVVQKILTEL